MKNGEYIHGLEIYNRVIRDRSKLPDGIMKNGRIYHKIINNNKIKDINLIYQSGEEYLKLSEIKNIMTNYIIYHDILDNDEKRYLENVIRPFKDRVLCIRKYIYCEDEYISIFVREINGDTSSFELPMFEKGSMYKNMCLGENYSVEELGMR